MMTRTMFAAAVSAAVLFAAPGLALADAGHGKSKATTPAGTQAAGGHQESRGMSGNGSSAGHGHSFDFGQPGNPANASRTVEVTMHDNYYEPEKVTVKAGETVRFVVRNEGQLVHEFNIGTAAMHEAHKSEMAMMVEHGVLHADRIDRAAAEQMQASMGHGMHNDPNSVLLEPGESGEVVWTFSQDADLEFACNVPGHYEAGMMGNIHVRP